MVIPPHYALTAAAAMLQSQQTLSSGGDMPGFTQAAMREMAFRMAAMRPVGEVVVGEEAEAPRRRRNVRVSKDPQSVAARRRREKISEKIRTLRKLVPGGTKMDTASMLEEAAHYVRFLKRQLQSLEAEAAWGWAPPFAFGFPATPNDHHHHQHWSM